MDIFVKFEHGTLDGQEVDVIVTSVGFMTYSKKLDSVILFTRGGEVPVKGTMDEVKDKIKQALGGN